MFLVNLLKSVINFISAPQYLVSLMLIVVLAALYWRPLWSKKGGIALFSLLALGIGLSHLDRNFAAVATLPDNVPIVAIIVLWCALIALGTFLRGPNWNFFGPYEFWDVT